MKKFPFFLCHPFRELANWLMDFFSLFFAEEKWSRSDSTSIGDGWRRRLFYWLGSISTHSQTKFAVTTTKWFASITMSEWFDYKWFQSFFTGKNLQICFMNEAASDSESSDSETCPKLSQGMSRKKNVQRPSSLMNHRNASLNNNPYSSHPLSVVKSAVDKGEVEKFTRLRRDLKGVFSTAERPTTLSLGPPTDPSDNNFFTHQARLQIEAQHPRYVLIASGQPMYHL